MTDGIYLIRGDNDLVEMREQTYDSEDLLQALLAQYPSVLAGDQLHDSEPRRWLLIKREAPLPAEEEGSDRWSVDHLFVDQDAIPTIVEVKRSSDSRIRREVVGQMLDYAANGVVYWPVDRLRSFFESTCEAAGSDAGEELGEFLGPDGNPEAFWDELQTNLKAGRVRLIFVADRIPSELRRVIEFLDQQMNLAEVRGVEIRQYVGEGLRTLVPRVIGTTAKPPASSRGRWDQDSFFAELGKLGKPDYVALAESLLPFGAELAGRPVNWGTGKNRGSYTAARLVGGKRVSLFSLYTDGYFSINLGWAHESIGTDASERFRSRTNDTLRTTFDRVAWRGWPRAPLSLLEGDGLEKFRQLLQEMAKETEALLAEHALDTS